MLQLSMLYSQQVNSLCSKSPFTFCQKFNHDKIKGNKHQDRPKSKGENPSKARRETNHVNKEKRNPDGMCGYFRFVYNLQNDTTQTQK